MAVIVGILILRPLKGKVYLSGVYTFLFSFLALEVELGCGVGSKLLKGGYIRGYIGDYIGRSRRIIRTLGV